MDLTATLLRAAAARPRVLLAVAAGGSEARLAVERALRERAWPVAASPADAGVLAVCGRPGPQMSAAVGRVWAAMSLPKARADAAGPHEAAAALDQARHATAALAAQRDIEAGERLPPSGELAMAERGPDRDGLALDRLHVTLGPVLTDWPAGLVLRLVLQGDVVQQATAERLDGGRPAAPSYWEAPWRRAAAGEPVAGAEAARRLVARHLDSVARLVAVAGWDGAALAARRLRDEALAGAGRDAVRGRYRRFRRRVAGSWLLRWMTRDLGRLDPAAAAAFGFPPARGDLTGRLRWQLERIGQGVDLLDDEQPLAGRLGSPHPLARPPLAGVEAVEALPLLARLVVGTELAVTRLLVASLDPDDG